MTAEAHALEGGFAAPVFDAQAVFRAVMEAMASPATIVRLDDCRVCPPYPLTPLAGAVACTLADADTPLWLDEPLRQAEAVSTWLGFHTGARIVAEASQAGFALIDAPTACPPFDRFAQGSQEYPDRSATLIMQLRSLSDGTPVTFEGPGIRTSATIAPVGLPEAFIGQWAGNAARFPRGIDLVLTAGNALACLPRTARIVEG